MQFSRPQQSVQAPLGIFSGIPQQAQQRVILGGSQIRPNASHFPSLQQGQHIPSSIQQKLGVPVSISQVPGGLNSHVQQQQVYNSLVKPVGSMYRNQQPVAQCIAYQPPKQVVQFQNSSLTRQPSELNHLSIHQNADVNRIPFSPSMQTSNSSVNLSSAAQSIPDIVSSKGTSIPSEIKVGSATQTNTGAVGHRSLHSSSTTASNGVQQQQQKQYYHSGTAGHDAHISSQGDSQNDGYYSGVQGQQQLYSLNASNRKGGMSSSHSAKESAAIEIEDSNLVYKSLTVNSSHNNNENRFISQQGHGQHQLTHFLPRQSSPNRISNTQSSQRVDTAVQNQVNGEYYRGYNGHCLAASGHSLVRSSSGNPSSSSGKKELIMNRRDFQDGKQEVTVILIEDDPEDVVYCVEERSALSSILPVSHVSFNELDDYGVFVDRTQVQSISQAKSKRYQMQYY